jgi:hypothetical protein
MSAGYTADMAPGLLLSALLSLPATQAQSAREALQPRLHVSFQPAVLRPAQSDGAREVVCGMVMIHKTPADDPKMLLPARQTGAAVRRIEPQGCGAKSVVTAK